MISDERTWIVVADGARARVIQYKGPDDALELVPNGEFDQPNLPTRELVTDDRGRSFAGKGISDARSAMDPTVDRHQFEEKRFVADVASFVNQHAGDFDHLIVAAAPRALGDFRKEISGNVQKKVYAELNKDLTNLSLRDLRSHLQGVININVH